MAHKKGEPKTPGSGRKKGSRNKITVSVKDMTLEALERAGGADYLHNLALTEPAVFSGYLRKCMPQVIEATVGTVKTVKFIDLSGKGKQIE
jgi:hypothetical protein